MVLYNRAVEQFNGREGETATFLSAFFVNSELRVGGFAPRHLKRCTILWTTWAQVIESVFMIELKVPQIGELSDWFNDEHSGSLVGTHIVHSGQGAAWVDQWPLPNALVLKVGTSFSLYGDAQALKLPSLQALVDGFVEAPKSFLPLLSEAFLAMKNWNRVVYVLEGPPQPQPGQMYWSKSLQDRMYCM